jgi:hypothetical protein
MSSEPNRHDVRLIDRFLDGAMSDVELAACRRRLEAEPALSRCLQQRARLRAGFHADRDAGPAPPAAFADRVVAAARRLPAVAEPDEGATIRVCRRILLAAAAVVAAALLWQSGLFRDRNDGTLQAAPDEAQRIIDALDAQISARGARK